MYITGNNPAIRGRFGPDLTPTLPSPTPFMPTFYITFAGGILINAETAEQALELFYTDSTGDTLLDAIDETEIHSTSNGRIHEKLDLKDPA